MNHSSMLRNGRKELWGNFNQLGNIASFASSESFVIAFRGSGQVAYFDSKDSGFANIDPVYNSVKIIDYPEVLENCMSYRISRGILTGLQDVLGIHELSQCGEALAAALGITLAELTPGIPQIVATSVASLMEIISIIQSLCTVADSAGGIYSTAMGEGNKYDKAEAFAHDATMLAVSLIFIWATVSLVKNCTALFKSASQNLIGRTTRITPAEVVNNSKSARMISSMGEFMDYTKGLLDEDALLYAKEVLGDDADDIARLKNVAQLIEDGSKKIGKKLSKEELKAGLDAFWDDGGAEGALGAIERCSQRKITIQTISNKFPNENQSGKIFNYTLENGKIKLENGIHEVDFIVDIDGNLRLGSGHSYLAEGNSVQAAGKMKVNSQGYVRFVNNFSGHYQPTVEQALNYPDILQKAGLNIDNAWIRINSFKASSSNYVIESEVFYNGPIKYMPK